MAPTDATRASNRGRFLFQCFLPGDGDGFSFGWVREQNWMGFRQGRFKWIEQQVNEFGNGPYRCGVVLGVGDESDIKCGRGIDIQDWSTRRHKGGVVSISNEIGCQSNKFRCQEVGKLRLTTIGVRTPGPPFVSNLDKGQVRFQVLVGGEFHLTCFEVRRRGSMILQGRPGRAAVAALLINKSLPQTKKQK